MKGCPFGSRSCYKKGGTLNTKSCLNGHGGCLKRGLVSDSPAEITGILKSAQFPEMGRILSVSHLWYPEIALKICKPVPQKLIDRAPTIDEVSWNSGPLEPRKGSKPHSEQHLETWKVTFSAFALKPIFKLKLYIPQRPNPIPLTYIGLQRDDWCPN